MAVVARGGRRDFQLVRLDVVLDAMAGRDVDAMVLGREANARAVADTKRLWLAGTRAFAPGCVVVRERAAVHVLSNSDDAVPEGFPVERLYGITWNPEKLIGALAAIPGLAEAERVAVDGMTPMMHMLLSTVAPQAELVDAAPLLTALWSLPDPERVDGVRAAAEVAKAGLAAMVEALRAGAHPRMLRGVCAQVFASFGVTTPAFEAVVTPLGTNGSTWLSPERVLAAHDVVVLRAGALRDGWEASVSRTFRIGADSVTERPPPAQWHSLLAACRAGSTAGDLRGRGAVVYGVGRGVESWEDDLTLAAGTTCTLEVSDTSAVHQDVLLLGERNPEILTSGI
jgi:Xaa-Pro dipeptidase